MLSTLTAMSTKGKITLGASVLGVLVVMFLLFQMASQPSYTTLMSGVDPAQTSKMTAALDAAGVGWQLQNNGTAVAVQKSQMAQAQVALASKGLNNGGQQPGFELLDKQKLGTSDFQQKITYQRALEGQIAQTVNQVQGVSGAQVRLTMPQDQLFSDQQQQPTAAVLLGGANALDPGAVRGIANLVASSVQGLKTSNVTITDGTGQMLWPTGDGTGAGSLAKPAAEARYAAGLETQIDDMLARTLGPGKAQVQINADLNVDQTKLDKLQYATRGVPLKSTSETETLKGTGAGAGATAGTKTNIPGYAQTGGGAGGNSNYKHTTKSTEWGVDKTIAHTQVAPGAVNRMNVALVVDKSVPPAAVAQLKAAVASAAGVQPKRGDTLAVSQVAFAKQPVPAAAGAMPKQVLGYAKYVLLALASILFLFFMTRQLKRREDETLMGEPTWLRQIEAPRTVAELVSAPEELSLQDTSDPRRAALEDVISREPERVAQQLRAWMDEAPEPE
jgi:flagellar M-ring protein FliF